MSSPVAAHFEDRAKQEQAARLGMWVFLASEILFFAGLFALYAAYRAQHPAGFGRGVAHNTIILGSINTAVLLVSSYAIAGAVHQLRRGGRRACVWLMALTMALGLVFLALKTTEYLIHFHEGIYPAGVGRFFVENDDPGTMIFFTLYFCMTGLHAIHVLVGMGILGTLLFRVRSGSIGMGTTYPLELGAVYWHLIDLIWIFLWPLFYLTPGSSG